MRALTKLFGRSPFTPLRSHMEIVAECIDGVTQLFKALSKKEYDKIDKLAQEISTQEHEADLLKNDIRNGLRSNLFLPVDRGNLLEALSTQDSIADKAEDIGAILTLKQLEIYPELAQPFDEFLIKNIECFRAVVDVIFELTELLESSFGGIESEKIKHGVDRVAYLEHKVDRLQHALLKQLYTNEREIPYRDFDLWMRLIEEIGAISNLSEKLANRILMTMELR